MSGVVPILVVVLVALVALELVLRRLDVADPPTFQYDEECGFRMRPDQSVSTRGLRFRINNVGLRGEDVLPRFAGERRIAFVGDSITYGGGSIPEANLFTTRVAAALSALRHERITAVNISAPGWGIPNMAAFLTAQGAFDADVVVWALPSADFFRPKTSLHLLGYPETRPWSRLIYSVRSWLFAVRSRRHQTRADLEAQSRARAGVLEANLGVLDATLRAMKSAAVQHVIAVLPDEGGYGTLSYDVLRFQSVAARNGARFIDHEPVFRDQKDLPLYLDGVHLNARGHELVAHELVTLVEAALASRKAREPG
jgi:lysophospholipase L1-like esterase